MFKFIKKSEHQNLKSKFSAAEAESQLLNDNLDHINPREAIVPLPEKNTYFVQEIVLQPTYFSKYLSQAKTYLNLNNINIETNSHTLLAAYQRKINLALLACTDFSKVNLQSRIQKIEVVFITESTFKVKINIIPYSGVVMQISPSGEYLINLLENLFLRWKADFKIIAHAKNKTHIYLYEFNINLNPVLETQQKKKKTTRRLTSDQPRNN